MFENGKTQLTPIRLSIILNTIHKLCNFYNIFQNLDEIQKKKLQLEAQLREMKSQFNNEITLLRNELKGMIC